MYRKSNIRITIGIKKSFQGTTNKISYKKNSISEPGADGGRLQLLAGHCLCNLSLGDEKYCRRIASTGGAYLVMRMDAMAPLLTVSTYIHIDRCTVWLGKEKGPQV